MWMGDPLRDQQNEGAKPEHRSHRLKMIDNRVDPEGISRALIKEVHTHGFRK